MLLKGWDTKSTRIYVALAFAIGFVSVLSIVSTITSKRKIATLYTSLDKAIQSALQGYENDQNSLNSDRAQIAYRLARQKFQQTFPDVKEQPAELSKTIAEDVSFYSLALGRWNKHSPGFIPSVSDTERADAMELRFRLLHPNRLKRLLAWLPFVPDSTRFVTDSRIARIPPRQSFVLFDLTGPLSEESHPRGEKARQVGSQDGFFIAPLIPGAICPTGKRDFSTTLLTALGPYRTLFSNFKSARGSTNDPRVYFRDDFTCISLGAGTTNCNGMSFLVDMFPGRRAEPLSSLQDGARYILDDLLQRPFPDDQIAVFGFDSGPPFDCRTTGVKLGRRAVYPDLSDASLRRLYSSFDTARSMSAVERFAGLMLPRVYDREQTQIVRSDIPFALQEVGKELQSNEPTILPRDSQVFLFTSGNTTCIRCGDTRGCGSFRNKGGCKLEAISERDALNRSIDESTELVVGPKSAFLSAQARVNVFMFGERFAPHEIVYANKDKSGCLSPSERATQNLPLTNFSGEDPLPWWPGVTRYYYPNKLAVAAARTGGHWFPIRPPCSVRSSSDLSNEIEQACKLGAEPGKPVALRTLLHCGKCGPTGCIRFGGGDPEVCKWVDDSGRLMCDPSGRSYFEQVIAAVRSAVSERRVLTTSDLR